MRDASGHNVFCVYFGRYCLGVDIGPRFKGFSVFYESPGATWMDRVATHAKAHDALLDIRRRLTAIN